MTRITRLFFQARRATNLAPAGTAFLSLVLPLFLQGTALGRASAPAMPFTPAAGGPGTIGQQAAPAEGARPVRALYVTGGGFHDFLTQESIVPPGIAERVRVEWTIDHSAGTSTETLIERHKDAEWTKAFDVVVYNMSFSHVVDVEWIERLARAHRDSGVHAVILHGAVHSYRRSDSRAWGELMGAFSMRHDRQRRLTIEVLAPEHPVMRGFPNPWTTIDEELYEIERAWPAMTPLARAYSVESKRHHPVIWTNTHGKARVFVTSLGHNNEMMGDPVYLDLVARGLLWAQGLLQGDGTPAAGYGPR